MLHFCIVFPYKPVHEISNNVVCATSKASNQPGYMSFLKVGCDAHPSLYLSKCQIVGNLMPQLIIIARGLFAALAYLQTLPYELWHEISNNLVCATIKASDQPAHTLSLIRAFACGLNIL